MKLLYNLLYMFVCHNNGMFVFQPGGRRTTTDRAMQM